jgi:hypothetical protein
VAGYNLAIDRDHVAFADEQPVSREKRSDGYLG